ncbi:hypothetical protein EH223_08670 [candidate division KSB1 bacterium]|nr:MAG: hypothetical protein EH223_08670 [candidate division KSB1 bacterium]
MMLHATQSAKTQQIGSQADTASLLCIVIDPPDDFFKRAAQLDIAIDQVFVRFTTPRKLIARLPVQLLAGLEVVTDRDIVREELQDVFIHFNAA